jgi:hypothetical protein
MPYKSGVYLPPETMGSPRRTLAPIPGNPPHFRQHPTLDMVAKPLQVAAFDLALAAVSVLSHQPL